ncbi:uncharacterized protein LOC134222229 [Armigeres subalbatus]|uniref:uncharacterized protein LOC134222229 n=1 Tax=Armigeres subalbatus TaxID=124917 RepID=UPI002ED11BC4
MYKELEQQLNSGEAYAPVNLILYAPSERKARYKYIQGLSFDFDVQVYRSFKPNATFVWKLPHLNERSEIQLSNTIVHLEDDIVYRVKADKCKQAAAVFGGIASWTVQKVKEFSQLATDDDPSSSKQDDLDGLKMLIGDGHEIEEVLHIETQQLNSRQGKFDNFWKAAEIVIAEKDLSVAQERRHGTTSWISPLCVSLRDLMDICEEKMNQLYPGCPNNNVPSAEYFRLQFTPRNPRNRTAERYYSRFDIKYGLQVRTLRKAHPDQHYGAKQFQYMKMMAGRFHTSSLVFFLDDKAAILVGFEGAPVSATRRQRSVLKAGLDNRGLNALDHDNIPQHLTPSISIKLISPMDLSNAWHAGQSCIILKDATHLIRLPLFGNFSYRF